MDKSILVNFSDKLTALTYNFNSDMDDNVIEQTSQSYMTESLKHYKRGCFARGNSAFSYQVTSEAASSLSNAPLLHKQFNIGRASI